jgi:(p)ppGpp synthase/HD superfamily hydrolase
VTGSLEFLKAAENRESFFRRIALIFPTLDPRYRLIERAYNDAKEAFRGVNREGGERYFEHIRAVALIVIDHLRVRDADVIVAALLHDIVEDRDDWTVDRVQDAYGERVALLVEYLSNLLPAGEAATSACTSTTAASRRRRGSSSSSSSQTAGTTC